MDTKRKVTNTDRRLDVVELGKPGRAGIYPWSDWTNGERWAIKKGRDFQIEPHSMAALVRKRGSGSELRAITKIEGDYVYFQFVPREPVGKAA